jgi:glycine betaine/proline transport system permease protein
MAAFVRSFGQLFRVVSAVLSWPMGELQHLLVWLPAPVFIAVSGLSAWQAAGRKICALVLCTFLYIWIAGYWVQSMNTLSLVCIAILLAALVGFAVGVLAYRSRSARAIIDPTLDLMQTIPTFAYLIPILLLFGFGPVVGLIASTIFATPPMVRNTLLGLQRVSPEVREAGLICGSSPMQLFWWVEIPAAAHQLKLGLNQTTMAAFAMIIIAAIIGGFDDIGWEVLSSIRRADFGASVLSGLVIVLLAMSLDRVTLVAAGGGQMAQYPRLSGKQFLAALVGALVIGWAVSSTITQFGLEPKQELRFVSEGINAALSYLTTTYSDALGSIKAGLLYFVILPVKLGLERVVTPHGWGISLTAPLIWAYWIATATVTLGLAIRVSPTAAATVFLTGCFLYVGTTGMPWAAFILVVIALAYWHGGLSLAAFAFVGQLFILLAGQWDQAMISVYLCATAVILSILVGIALGIWGAGSDRISSVLRQVNDALQTVPQFVFLIPALMLFGVGDFTGLIAIVLYSIVPSIRYTEHGLRQVPLSQIEAATSMGCTRWQMLWQVRLPLALPEILLGINQTILFAMGMLVIASLVGTDGLGQQIYIGLGKNDPGIGIVAGLALAVIGMLADRILRSASAARKAALGVT